MPLKSSHFSLGNTYRHFQVTKRIEIPELHCELIELVHLHTGARVIHIANDDQENMFCLSLQTLPSSSNGVAHILEHTVLCGSKKFPIKDPFFAMQRRSLNTFMNALTGPDFTCYPAASQVPKDFYNLMEVYIDAVFHPLLNPLSFLQEGHRLEFTDPADPDTPLQYKGIVFNEMKGALASPSTRMNEAIGQALFPDLTYGINAGGDPRHIPTLSYEELRAFHRTYYHPSRCLFFFYGNMPLEGHLDFIADHALKDIEPVLPLPPLPLQPRFTQPRRILEGYPIPEEEDIKDKALISFAWLTCHILEQQELLALNILEIILMDTDASPLKMALLKSGLCKQALCYMEDEITEVPLIITLKGCNAESADALEEIIKKTLEKVTRTGISLSMVENAIHQLEFFRSEITGDHAPFGLALFMRSALLRQHGGDAESGLKIHSLFDEIRRRNLEDPHYLTGLLKKYLLDNPHFIRIVLAPDKTLAHQELEEENAELAAIRAGLTPEMCAIIVRKAAELAAFQQKQEEDDVDVLPTVTLLDIPHEARTYPLQQETCGSLKIFSHHCFTNEILYADLIFNLPDIPKEDLSYLRLMTTLLSQMGCNGRNYAENLEYIQANTGGIGSSLTFNLQAANHAQFFPSLYIRGKALHRKVDKLFTLLKETASSVNFNDIGRLKEVINKQYTALQSGLNQSALRYAVMLSAASLDIPSTIAQAWYGLEYFWKIKALAADFDKQADWLTAKLQELQNKVLCLEKPELLITCDAEMYNQIKGNHFYGIQHQQDSSSVAKWKGNYPIQPGHSQGRIIASPIAFIAKVIKTVSYVDPDAPALCIAAHLLDTLFLHPLLRERGGAYGGGAVCNPMGGNFYFYSYRDPHILSTLETFDFAVKELIKGHFDASDLEEAKIEMAQSLDAPVAPGSRGDIAYGWLREGKTHEMRQAFRDKILSLSAEHVINAVEAHLIPGLNSSYDIVFAGKELLERENGRLQELGKKPFPLENI